jgi:2,3-diketo-5-methylthio-1-phosphopentane phosphatase
VSETRSERGEAGLALLVDFDDTAAAQNVAELLLTRFADEDWRGIREQFRRGETNLRTYQEDAFATTEASEQEMQEYVRQAGALRGGFLDLVRYCITNDIQVAIASNGLTFYIRALLDEHDVTRDLPVYGVETRGSPGDADYAYPYATETCWEWGNCKCLVLQKYRDQGRRVLFAGDGMSDACAAGRADFVYARSKLLEHCRKARIPHQAFEEFTAVLADIRRRREMLPVGRAE